MCSTARQIILATHIVEQGEDIYIKKCLTVHESALEGEWVYKKRLVHRKARRKWERKKKRERDNERIGGARKHSKDWVNERRWIERNYERKEGRLYQYLGKCIRNHCVI